MTFTYKISGKKKWVQRPFGTDVFLSEKDYSMLNSPRRKDLKINPDIFEKQFTGSGSYENLAVAFFFLLYLFA